MQSTKQLFSKEETMIKYFMRGGHLEVALEN